MKGSKLENKKQIHSKTRDSLNEFTFGRKFLLTI